MRRESDYFLDSYEACKDAFMSLAHDYSSEYLDGQLQSFQVPSKIDNELSVDVFYKPAKNVYQKLIVMVSGIHGIEAYTGSAVQRLFLKEIMPKLIDPDTTGVLLIHGLNPFGFKYCRRVSENNVDLNRNFFKDEADLKRPNKLYARLNKRFAPQFKYKSKSFTNYLWILQNVLLGLRYGILPFKKALLSGQYEYEKGLHYGGKCFEPNKKILDHILAPVLSHYEKIISVDLHTGYGIRNKLQLASLFTDENVLRQYKDYFKQTGTKVQSKVSFGTTGSFAAYIVGLVNAHQSCASFTFEFGTVNNHRLFPSILSLKTIINENQAFHYGCESEEDKKRIVEYFKHIFYPGDERWRQAVIRQSKEILPLVLKDF